MDLIHSDTSTLDGTRYILTVKNENKLRATGPLDPGTPVLCLRRNDFGYYLPAVATVVRVTPSGRVTVDLYDDRSERVTVSQKAILWNLRHCTACGQKEQTDGLHTTIAQYSGLCADCINKAMKV